jgi:hypothetical protein
MTRWFGGLMLVLALGCNGDDDGNGNGNGDLDDGIDDSDFGDDDNPQAPDIPPEAELVDRWEGDLGDGRVPDSLDFLETARCVPGTEFANFDGAHVFYTYDQPAGRQVYVRVRPEDDVDVSLYVSQLPAGSGGSGIDDIADPCEESLDYPNDNNPGVAESVKLTSVGNAYRLVIGVAGANGATTGGFLVEIHEE